MALGGFTRLWVVFLNVLCSEQRPFDKDSGLNCLDSCRFHWVAIDRVHPLDCLLYGWQVIDTVGLGELQTLCFGEDSWAPLPLLPLVQWDVVSAFVAADAD